MNQLTRRSLLALICAAPAGATYAGALGGGDARRLAGIPRTAEALRGPDGSDGDPSYYVVTFTYDEEGFVTGSKIEENRNA